MSLPLELRVLCRRIASTDPDDLPRLCPSLVSLALRCAETLSAPQETKPRDGGSEASVFVHRLRTQITSLLNGKSPGGRFAAVVLVKAVVDVGGWETLRLCEPWIQGLISVVRRPGSAAVKELAVVALAKIYALLHGYPTLTREIATPTVVSFVDACLQAVKPPPAASGRLLPAAATASFVFVETVLDALACLVPLYPTTLRPRAAQIRDTVRPYLAPTSSDPHAVPRGASTAARRLLVSLHHTAPKNTSGDEWAKAFRDAVRDAHATADQIFRAVQESWESTAGYFAQKVSPDGEPHGGGASSAEQLPPWSGVQAGSERLVGLLQVLAAFFGCPTRSQVSVPLGAVVDLVSRISLVAPPAPGPDESRHPQHQINPAIARDEREHLWSVLADVQVAALELLLAAVRRLAGGAPAVSLAREALDQTVRIYRSTRHAAPAARKTAYRLARELLVVTGPTLERSVVDSLALLVQGCCRDLLASEGYVPPPPQGADQKSEAAANGARTTTATRGKQQAAAGNADAYLKTQQQQQQQQSSNPVAPSGLAAAADEDHLAAARALLPFLLSHLPQGHLTPDARGLLDRTAILCRSKAAMLASCLHPYRDKNGRYYPSILPFLVRQFPRDQEVEVLRCHLRTPPAQAAAPPHEAWDPQGGLETLLRENPAAAVEEDAPFPGAAVDAEEQQDHGTLMAVDEEPAPGIVMLPSFLPAPAQLDTATATAAAPDADDGFRAVVTESRAVVEAASWEPATMAPLKRKGEELEADSPKRLEKIGKAIETVAPDGGSDSDSDSGGSVQIDMTLDDDDEEEEDGEDGEDA